MFHSKKQLNESVQHAKFALVMRQDTTKTNENTDTGGEREGWRLWEKKEEGRREQS